MATITDNDAAYRGYVSLLLELHRLMKDGQSDSEEADRVREASESFWWKLSDEQQDRVTNLSEDLFSLEATQSEADDGFHGYATEQAKQHLERLYSEQNWREILGILQQDADLVTPDVASYYRGRGWIGLGELEAGILFLRDAARRNSFFAPSMIVPLVRTERIDEAKHFCNVAIPQVNEPILNRFLTAHGCGTIAVHAAEEERMSWAKLAADIFEEVIARGVIENTDAELLTSTYSCLSINYVVLGNRQQATSACERALAIDPKSPQARFVEAWLQSEWAEQDGVSDSSTEVLKALVDIRLNESRFTILPSMLPAA